VASSASTALPPSRWLPFWSILEMDLKQTLRSWLYRLGILAALVVSIGVLLNRAAVHREAGIPQYASIHVGDFLQYSVIFGAALAGLISASAIVGERGNMADSVLSRGVGRWHYFVGKWSARMLAVWGGFLAVGLLFMVACVFVLKSDLDFYGCITGLLLVGSVLTLIVSGALAISVAVNNTMLGVGLILFLLYGFMAVVWLVPIGEFTLTRFLGVLPAVIRSPPPGYTGLPMMPYVKFAAYVALSGCGIAGVGMLHFMRKDV
jgi:ABC-2 type transport system permease protein